jgi:RNA polymerase sigma-70 factor (ECF subfamily)
VSPGPRDEVARVFREEYGRCVATLTRLLGDIELAEEAVRTPSSSLSRSGRDSGPTPACRRIRAAGS